MKEIDDASKAILKAFQVDSLGPTGRQLVVLSERLELVAKAARREALYAAARELDVISNPWDAPIVVRRMAKED